MSPKSDFMLNESSGKLPDEISVSETSPHYHPGTVDDELSGSHRGSSGSTQNDRGDMHRMGKIQELKVSEANSFA